MRYTRHSIHRHTPAKTSSAIMHFFDNPSWGNAPPPDKELVLHRTRRTAAKCYNFNGRRSSLSTATVESFLAVNEPYRNPIR